MASLLAGVGQLSQLAKLWLRLTINDNCSRQLSNTTSFMRLSCGRHLQGMNC